MVKVKYHHGHQLTVPQRWVFGVYNPETKQGYIQLVDERDAAAPANGRGAAGAAPDQLEQFLVTPTILPIIQHVVAPGTTIWSDEWAAYGQLLSLGYTHSTVNYSRNVKDPFTGTYTKVIR